MFRSFETSVDGDMDSLERVHVVLSAHTTHGFSGVIAVAGKGVYCRAAKLATRKGFSGHANDMYARLCSASAGRLDFAYIFAVAVRSGEVGGRRQLVQGALIRLHTLGSTQPRKEQLVHNVCARFECAPDDAGKWTVGVAEHVPSAQYTGEADMLRLGRTSPRVSQGASSASSHARPSAANRFLASDAGGAGRFLGADAPPPRMLVRCSPSKLPGCGVGIFPIEPIASGEVVFHFHWRDHKHTTPIRKFPPGARREYLRSIWSDGVPVGIYFHPVNFLNHSAIDATVYYHDDSGDYIATRDLVESDEITIDYRGYNEPRLSKFAGMLTGEEREELERGPAWGQSDEEEDEDDEDMRRGAPAQYLRSEYHY